MTGVTEALDCCELDDWVLAADCVATEPLLATDVVDVVPCEACSAPTSARKTPRDVPVTQPRMRRTRQRRSVMRGFVDMPTGSARGLRAT